MNIEQVKKEFKEIRDNLFGGSANLQQTQKLLVMVADLGQELEMSQKHNEEEKEYLKRRIASLEETVSKQDKALYKALHILEDWDNGIEDEEE